MRTNMVILYVMKQRAKKFSVRMEAFLWYEGEW